MTLKPTPSLAVVIFAAALLGACEEPSSAPSSPFTAGQGGSNAGAPALGGSGGAPSAALGGGGGLAGAHAGNAGNAGSAGLSAAGNAGSLVDPFPGPPTLLEQHPASGSEGLYWFAPIRLTFSEPLDPESLAGAIQVLGQSGAPLAINVSLSGNEVTLRLAASVALPTTLEVAVGPLRDLSGEAFFGTAFELHYERWFSVTEKAAAFPFGRSPALAVAEETAVVAHLEGQPSLERVQLTAYRGNTVAQLGSPVSNAAAAHIALSPKKRMRVLAREEAIFLSWLDGSSAFASSYQQGAWREASTLGAGPASVVGLAWVGGAPFAGVLSSSGAYQLYRHTDTFQPFGPALDLSQRGSILGLELVSRGGVPAVAVASSEGQIEVLELTSGAWVASGPPLQADAHANFELAAAGSGSSVLVGFTREAPGIARQLSVFRLTAGLWQQLGGPLNAELGQAAASLQVSFDAVERPSAAWAELGPGGVALRLAHFDEEGWRYHGAQLNERPATGGDGAVSLTRDSRGHLALAFRWVQEGALEVRRSNGDPTTEVAELLRPAAQHCSFPEDGPSFPALLSQTGCYTNTATKALAADLFAYELNSPLWSDAASKRRFFSLPPGTTISHRAEGALELPVGTVLVKEFWLEGTEGLPFTSFPVETRFLVKRCEPPCAAPWQGYSYQWNPEATDGSLLAADEGGARPWLLDSGAEHLHIYPTRGQCLRCHHESVGFALGFQASQLDRVKVMGNALDHQLEAWQRAGLLAPDFFEATPGHTRLTNPLDLSASSAARARAYLHANCSHCHNPQGERSSIDLRFSAPLASDNICNVVTAGSASGSLLFQRAESRSSNQMPPLATLLPDPLGISVLHGWLEGLQSCP